MTRPLNPFSGGALAPARRRRARPEDERLLVVDPRESHMHTTRIGDIAAELRPNDLVIVNDAATLPAALRGTVCGEVVELRLLAPPRRSEAPVLLFGEGNSHMRTEDRGPPPRLVPGDIIALAGFSAAVLAVERRGRMAHVRFDRTGAALFIPAPLVETLRSTRREGGRVVAVGTTVVRALESSALASGEVVAGEGESTLRIGTGFAPRVTDGLLTGLHEPGTSHFMLVSAFAPNDLLARAIDLAILEGWLGHELGDSMLVLGSKTG